MNFGRNFDCQSKQKDTLYVEIVFLFLITSKLASNLNSSAAHDVKLKKKRFEMFIAVLSLGL